MYRDLSEIIREAGALSLRYFGGLYAEDIQHKSEADLVTAADNAVEALLRNKLHEAFPDFGFVGEESVTDEQQERSFIVDPIDGTTGFVHGIPFYAVSVAVKTASGVTAGAVYVPPFDDLYYAEKGGGAWKNGEAITVSRTETLTNALGATGFACVRDRKEPNNLPVFCHILPRIRGIRRLGSAAIDLCFVAEGRFDMYWEMNLNSWDVAAGSLMVTEAGGSVTDFNGGDRMDEASGQIAASNGVLHGSLLEMIREGQQSGK